MWRGWGYTYWDVIDSAYGWNTWGTDGRQLAGEGLSTYGPYGAWWGWSPWSYGWAYASANHSFTTGLETSAQLSTDPPTIADKASRGTQYAPQSNRQDVDLYMAQVARGDTNPSHVGGSWYGGSPSPASGDSARVNDAALLKVLENADFSVGEALAPDPAVPARLEGTAELIKADASVLPETTQDVSPESILAGLISGSAEASVVEIQTGSATIPLGRKVPEAEFLQIVADSGGTLRRAPRELLANRTFWDIAFGGGLREVYLLRVPVAGGQTLVYAFAKFHETPPAAVTAGHLLSGPFTAPFTVSASFAAAATQTYYQLVEVLPDVSDLAAAQGVYQRDRLGTLNALNTSIEIAYSFVPVAGTLYQAYVAEDASEALISGIGDAALGLGLVARGLVGLRAVVAAGALVTLEGGVAVYRASQAVEEYRVNHDTLAAAGKAGEALLRIAGVGFLAQGFKNAAKPAARAVQKTLEAAQKTVKAADFVPVELVDEAAPALRPAAGIVEEATRSGGAAGSALDEAASGVAKSAMVSRILAKLDLYPKVIDSRTGRNIVFPSGVHGRVDKALRVVWDSKSDRADFIAEWYRRGYATPRGGWAKYDIHHIQPLEFGGTNNFWNLVPVERGTHSRLFNDFWRKFEVL